MVRDVASYKEVLMTKKNKWGESAIKPEEVKTVIAAVTDIVSRETPVESPLEEEKKEEAKVTQPKPQRHTDLNTLVNTFQNIVVQKYLETPCLINSRKFDLRVFMVIICCKPYFVFSQGGYARISLNDYTTESFGKTETLADGKISDWPGRITHLTNLAIQKKHPEFKTR